MHPAYAMLLLACPRCSSAWAHFPMQHLAMRSVLRLLAQTQAAICCRPATHHSSRPAACHSLTSTLSPPCPLPPRPARTFCRAFVSRVLDEQGAHDDVMHAQGGVHDACWQRLLHAACHRFMSACIESCMFLQRWGSACGDRLLQWSCRLQIYKILGAPGPFASTHTQGAPGPCFNPPPARPPHHTHKRTCKMRRQGMALQGTGMLPLTQANRKRTLHMMQVLAQVPLHRQGAVPPGPHAVVWREPH